MSLSWTSVSLYLAPDRVFLRTRGATHALAIAEPGWAGAIAALTSLLDAHKPGGHVAVALSSHFAPVWLLPGAPTALNHEETRGWVESQVAERFGDIAANWRIAFRPAPTGEPILASGIDAGQCSELLKTLTAAGLAAASVTAWPALALTHYSGRGTARLALLENGRLTLASLARGELVALDSARGEPDAMAGPLARAALVDGLGEAPLLIAGTGVAGDWNGARVLANTPETATLSGSVPLDFLRTRPRPPPAAWLLLAVGLGLAALAGGRHAMLAEQRDLLVVPETSVGARPRPVTDGTTTPARPWSALLDRLESGRPRQIALLSLHADASRGEARIGAVARTAADMLAWLDALRAAGFGNASLTRHDVQTEDALRPVRFEIRLAWGKP